VLHGGHRVRSACRLRGPGVTLRLPPGGRRSAPHGPAPADRLVPALALARHSQADSSSWLPRNKEMRTGRQRAHRRPPPPRGSPLSALDSAGDRSRSRSQATAQDKHAAESPHVTDDNGMGPGKPGPWIRGNGQWYKGSGISQSLLRKVKPRSDVLFWSVFPCVVPSTPKRPKLPKRQTSGDA